MSTVSVTMNDGKKNDVAMLSEEEIDRLQADPDTASRKVIVDHLKALNCPVTEIIKMKEPDRKAWILKTYAELGASTATKAKGKLSAVKNPPKAAPAPAQDDEDEDDDDDAPAPAPAQAAAKKPGAAAASAPAGDTAELKKLILGLGQQIHAMSQELAEVKTELADTKAIAQGQSGFLLDAHFMIRSLLPSAAGFSADDLPAFKDDNYGKMVVEPDDVEDEGNE